MDEEHRVARNPLHGRKGSGGGAADAFRQPVGFERPAWDAAGLLGEAPFWGRFWDCPVLAAEDRTWLTALREDLSARLAAIAPGLERLRVSAPVLVGHSMGSQVVVELARREPHLRGRMVLVAPVVHVDQRRLSKVLTGFARSAVLERFGAALVSVRGYLSAGLRWPLELLPAMVRYPIEDRIADLGGRLVIVRGEHDLLCPPQWAERLLNRSGAEGSIIVAEGAAHQVVVDNADEVVAAAIAVSGRGPLP